MEDGATFKVRRDDYHGFHTRPFDWAAARSKFDRLTHPFTTKPERDALADVIATLDQRPVTDLTSLLGKICTTTPAPSLSPP